MFNRQLIHFVQFHVVTFHKGPGWQLEAGGGLTVNKITTNYKADAARPLFYSCIWHVHKLLPLTELHSTRLQRVSVTAVWPSLASSLQGLNRENKATGAATKQGHALWQWCITDLAAVYPNIMENNGLQHSMTLCGWAQIPPMSRSTKDVFEPSTVTKCWLLILPSVL